MKKVNIVLFLGLISASIASATTVTFIGVNGVEETGLVDTGLPVLPYDLTINGSSYLVDCYDFFDSVSYGQTWNATELTLSQVISTGRFSSFPNARIGYEQIAILSSFSTLTALSQIDLQNVIWDVFDPGLFPFDAGMTADLNRANAELTTFNYSNTVFLEAPGVQDFVFSNTPEPTTFMIFSIGLCLIGVSKSRMPR